MGMTAANIGGVAINDGAGETVGIINSIDQTGASLISTAQIAMQQDECLLDNQVCQNHGLASARTDRSARY